MTIAELHDYLSQFPSYTVVLLHADDANSLADDTPHVALDVLDFTPSEHKG